MSPTRFAALSLLLLPLSLLCGSSAWAQAPSTATWVHQPGLSPAALCTTTQVAQVTPAQASAPATPAATVVAQPAPGCTAAGCSASCAGPAPCAAESTCNGKCRHEWHCPKYCFSQEQMPCIKFACKCAKPLAEPCSVADEVSYGYTPTCWRPMGPLDYTHCTCPPPAILAQEPGQRSRIGDPTQDQHAPEKAPEDEPAPAPNRVGMTAPQRP